MITITQISKTNQLHPPSHNSSRIRYKNIPGVLNKALVKSPPSHLAYCFFKLRCWGPYCCWFNLASFTFNSCLYVCVKVTLCLQQRVNGCVSISVLPLYSTTEKTTRAQLQEVIMPKRIHTVNLHCPFFFRLSYSQSWMVTLLVWKCH